MMKIDLRAPKSGLMDNFADNYQTRHTAELGTRLLAPNPFMVNKSSSRPPLISTCHSVEYRPSELKFRSWEKGLRLIF